jgi:hypothetical protein
MKSDAQSDDLKLESKLIKIWANIGEVFLMQTKNLKVKFTGDLKKLKCPSALTLETLRQEGIDNYHL